MSKQSKKTLRSTQELNARYARFCETNELDSTIAPELQIAESEKQQMWLDNLVSQLKIAELEGRKLARGRTDVVREISLKTSVKRALKDALTNTINIAVDMSPKSAKWLSEAQKEAQKVRTMNYERGQQMSLFG